MNPEKRNLLDAVLDDAQHRREAILLASAPILRRRRWARTARRCSPALAVLAIAVVISMHKTDSPKSPTYATAPPPTEPRGLTDEELLALFPDTPVGLVTLENGKQRLVFPRPGDEALFVTRL